MRRVLKTAILMAVISLAILMSGLTAAVNPLPGSSSLSADKSGSLLLNNLNVNKNHSSATPLDAVMYLNKNEGRADEKSSVSCKTEPCNGPAEKSNVPKLPTSTSSHEVSSEAEGMTHDSNKDLRKLNPEALMRGLYVFAGLSVIVMVYIAWKSFGKRPAQVHRYGVITTREDLEMAPLDSDDGDGDEDDTTHFDISKHRLK